ncbi:ATP-binding protein [Paenibacillus sp. FJAT-26967]|uniref:ATP-binding protein n=1 Tax=Paenibacillus sp. FJAT-26967 TaxID=1729690 RepID=UPI0008387895|nr:ATP-binding protein [Paenibacillus sp. FJAT-26967]
MYKWFVASYASVITVLSLSFGLALHNLLLIGLCILLILAHLTKEPSLYVSLSKLALLIMFHWISQTDWCFSLYILILTADLHDNKSKSTIWTLVGLNMILFPIISKAVVHSFTTFSTLWGLVLYVTNSAVFILISVTLISSIKQGEKLAGERKKLTTHDALTGLPNYESCHKQLKDLLHKESHVMFILIDCTDLKAMNKSQGFQAGNLILKQVADLLQIKFSEAFFISRYGGDEFAVALAYTEQEQMLQYIEQQLGSELPKLTGIQITYGSAVLTDKGGTKDDLILLAENNLFQMKREMWLKREEHMLRSEKLRIVGELASGMAHEIRNPLTTIKGFLQISKSNGYNIENWYPLIMDEISRMSELTAEFLQFSKPHAVHFRVQSFQVCIQRVISLTLSEMSRFGHEVVYVPPQEPMNIWMDQDKMIQLLINLIKNAYESMEDNKKVIIRLYPRDYYVVLEVEDQGSGIPPEQLDQIFNPFYTTKDSGTGLGLSICHKIVQDHDGTIEIESTVNKGTRFIMTFPMASPEESNPAYSSRKKDAV